MRRKKAAAKPSPADRPPSMRSDTAQRTQYRAAPWLIAVGLVLGSILAFGSVCGKDAEFLRLDDGDYVANNPNVRGGLTWENIQWALTTFHAANWHPLTWLSLELDSSLYGVDPAGYHLTNLLLHAANAVLFFVVLERMTQALWLSALAAALFAFHPLRVESVAWIAERKDVLSSFFWLLTMLAYWWYVQRPAAGRYLLMVAAFALGLMAKQMLVTLPFVLLLLDYWPLGRFGALPERRAPWQRLLIEKLPLLAMAAAASVLTIRAQAVTETPLLLNPSLPLRALNAFLACLEYLRKTFWPSDLAPMYSRPPHEFPLTEAIVATILVVVMSLFVVWQRKRRPYLAVGWLWFVGSLVPVIGLVQVGIQTMADRYTYIPHMGLFIMLTWGLRDLLADHCPPPLPSLGAAVLVLACLVVSRSQTQLWEKNVTLWENAVQVTRDNFGAHDNLGVALTAQGRVEEGMKHFQIATQIEPQFAMGHYHLGLALEQSRQWSAARRSFAEAVRIAPDFAPALSELGGCLVQEGRMDDAIAPLTAAVQRVPDVAQGHYNLSLALLYRGRNLESIREASAALRLEPQLREPHKLLGFALAVEGKPAEAETHFRAALWTPPPNVRLDPTAAYYLGWCLHAQNRPEAGREQYRLADQAFRDPRARADFLAGVRKEAWQLATDPDPARRNGRLALLRVQVVNQVLEEKDAAVLDTLAAADAELGRFADAVAAARQAIAMANADQKGAFEKRLKLYEQGQPFRDKVSRR